MSDFLFNKTLIIGLGMIGGSFARAIRKNNISRQIVAIDIDQKSLDLAKDNNAIDYGFDDIDFLGGEFDEIDLVVIAVNLSSYEEVFDKLLNLASNQLVIDLGSVKDLKLKNVPNFFIPCHPIAGSEDSGFRNSNSDLFQDTKFIICKSAEVKNATYNQAIDQIVNLAKRIGANPEFMSPDRHDHIYALVSHLPQFLSFLTKEFSPKNIKDNFFQKVFRLDGSDPGIWLDIFNYNGENIEEFYLEFFDNLQANVKKIQQNQESIELYLKRLKSSFYNLNQNNKLLNININFLKSNFDVIFLRFLITISYLDIRNINQYISYSGDGFKDFTSVISILDADDDQLIKLIKLNKDRIVRLVDKISN